MPGSLPLWPTNRPTSWRSVLVPVRPTMTSISALPPMVQVGREPGAFWTTALTVNSFAVQLRVLPSRVPAQVVSCKAAVVTWAPAGATQTRAETRKAESSRRPVRVGVRRSADTRPAPGAWRDPCFKCISVSLVEPEENRIWPTPWPDPTGRTAPIYRVLLPLNLNDPLRSVSRTTNPRFRGQSRSEFPSGTGFRCVSTRRGAGTGQLPYRVMPARPGRLLEPARLTWRVTNGRGPGFPGPRVFHFGTSDRLSRCLSGSRRNTSCRPAH